MSLGRGFESGVVLSGRIPSALHFLNPRGSARGQCPFGVLLASCGGGRSAVLYSPPSRWPCATPRGRESVSGRHRPAIASTEVLHLSDDCTDEGGHQVSWWLPPTVTHSTAAPTVLRRACTPDDRGNGEEPAQQRGSCIHAAVSVAFASQLLGGLWKVRGFAPGSSIVLLPSRSGLVFSRLLSRRFRFGSGLRAAPWGIRPRGRRQCRLRRNESDRRSRSTQVLTGSRASR